ncbi:MAG TPA: peptidylprolyl isomerase [Bryobacteraceae bacterium]|jgi:peptidyl-prolyl cis-trans isomerase SurA
MNKRRSLLALLLAAIGIAAGCHKGVPAGVVATVNNHPITKDDLERNYRMQPMANPEGLSEDEIQIQKLDLLNKLIEADIMLQRAEKLGLLVTDADVEAKYNELKAPYTIEEFNKQLKSRNMTAQDLKTQLRKDLSIQKLLNKEIASRINITDADVKNFYSANQKSFNFAEPQFHLMQIVVTPGPDPSVRNLKNDKAQNDEQAKKKIEAIQGRLMQGEDFANLAQNYSEDPQTIQNGGDLGFLPESAFDKTPPQIRKLILSLQPGQLSPILPAQDSYRILKMISKEPAGQRDLSDPRVSQNIRDRLINRKDQLLKTAYYETARNEAKVVNYLAQSITESAGAPGK